MARYAYGGSVGEVMLARALPGFTHAPGTTDPDTAISALCWFYVPQDNMPDIDER